MQIREVGKTGEKETAEMQSRTEGKNGFWSRAWVVCLTAVFCNFLWGSAFPCIKAGYQLFQISSEDVAGRILFAGARFALAGLLVICIGSLQAKHFLHPVRTSIRPVIVLMFFQTILQYALFYSGLANASGVSSAIIESSNIFLTILIAVYLFHYEKMTSRKLAGSIIGFLGVLLVQIPVGGGTFGFSFTGEGFILLSAISSALSAGFIKKYSQTEDPVMLSGWQFLLGGLVLAAGGWLAGGRLKPATGGAWILLLYMAFISAVAYTLYSILLKYNAVSRVAVYNFTNPLFGVLLSALILGEKNQAFSVLGLLALLLVTIGIVMVNRTGGWASAEVRGKMKRESGDRAVPDLEEKVSETGKSGK